MEYEELSHLLVEFYEKLSSWEHDVVRKTGLTLPQMHALEMLGVHGAMRMKELAEKTGVTTGSMTVMVDKLEKGGLALRMPNEADRRSILVDLTELGRKHFREHDEMHLQLTGDIAGSLSGNDLRTFVRSFKKLLERF